MCKHNKLFIARLLLIKYSGKKQGGRARDCGRGDTSPAQQRCCCWHHRGSSIQAFRQPAACHHFTKKLHAPRHTEIKQGGFRAISGLFSAAAAFAALPASPAAGRIGRGQLWYFFSYRKLHAPEIGGFREEIRLKFVQVNFWVVAESCQKGGHVGLLLGR